MTTIIEPITHEKTLLGSDLTGVRAGAVSWAAIFAGGATAASLSLILLILGTGLGLAFISPWSGSGVSASSLSLSGILWISFASLVASGAGGYIAGRLRTRWVDVHQDEVYFRDTAHGFLAWALATLISAGLLTSAATSIVSGSVQAGASMVGGVSGMVAETGGDELSDTGAANNPFGYSLDLLFRGGATSVTPAASSQAASPYQSQQDLQPQVLRIFANAVRTGELPASDRQYVAQLVAQQTQLTQQEAEQRVTQAYEQIQQLEAEARQALDDAREASAYVAMWLVVSLLIGAFAASFTAIYGGRQRDL